VNSDGQAGAYGDDFQIDCGGGGGSSTEWNAIAVTGDGVPIDPQPTYNWADNPIPNGGTGSGGSDDPPAIADDSLVAGVALTFGKSGTLRIGDEIFGTVTVTYQSGRTATDVVPSWTISSPDILGKDGDNFGFDGLASGEATVTAGVAGYTSSASLTVIVDLDSLDTEDDDSAPDCIAGHLSAKEADWCNAQKAQSNATWMDRINAALSDMRARGGVCQGLADTLAVVLADSNIHVSFSNLSTFAPLPGDPETPGAGGRAGFVTIGRDYVNKYSDADHPLVTTAGEVTLQFALAHEADHLLNNRYPNGWAHLEGPTEGTTTPNAVACGRGP
jgi:hypothetical protein